MPAHCNCDDCLSLYHHRQWVAEHPFPSYEDMCARIDALSIELGAEYGEYNHTALKKMYESKMNEVLCKGIGKAIYDRGGMKALMANCTIFKYCTPMAYAPPNVKEQASVLDYYWDGIGTTNVR